MTPEQQREQLKKDYQGTFGTVEGKRVLEDLVRRSGIRRGAVSADKTQPIDPYRVVYEEGRRAVVLHIQLMVEKVAYEERSKTAKD